MDTDQPIVSLYTREASASPARFKKVKEYASAVDNYSNFRPEFAITEERCRRPVAVRRVSS
jgi:hypothetical protein